MKRNLSIESASSAIPSGGYPLKEPTAPLRPLREPVHFEVASNRVWGTIDRPSDDIAGRRVGVVMCNSDDGCRLGPHRLWVRLAERLNAKGFACLRFDYRGCGDSEGPEGPPPGNVGLQDVLEAEHFLRQRTGVEATVLVGICYGAEVALLAGQCRETVRGVVACSVGRYVTSEGYARTVRHARAYLTRYARKLGQPATWRKILRGRVAMRTILGGLWTVLSPSAHQRDRTGAIEAEAIVHSHRHRPPSLFIYGTADPLYPRHGPGYQREADELRLERSFRCIDGADHNFSRLTWSEQVIDCIESFVETVAHQDGEIRNASGDG